MGPDALELDAMDLHIGGPDAVELDAGLEV
jgi:hypothetical protein